MMQRIVTHWRNALSMSMRMMSKEIVGATFLCVLRGYKNLLWSLHVLYGALMVGILFFVEQQVRLRMVWWLAGYTALVSIPLAAIVANHTALIYTILQFVYVTLWALAVRASIGQKNTYYFLINYVRYWWVWGIVAGFYYCVIHLFIINMSSGFIKNLMTESSHAVYVHLIGYAFIASVLIWALAWFMWYALDDTATEHVVRTCVGAVYYVFCNIPLGIFLVISAWGWTALWYGITWGVLQGLALIIPAMLRATSVIFTVFLVSYCVIYPVISAWFYNAYALTRYSRPDRYLMLFGEE